ncbi:MAG TPA: hypothetical protein VN522_03630 [Solirubrobacterales bacterium]|nr:hypothetical protein [Solirubrobacterales bacterium]
MQKASTNGSAADGVVDDVLIDKRPIDHLHESRAARIFAPILVVLGTATLFFLIVIKKDGAESVIGPALSLATALLLLIRTRRPMHTWPEWLFTRKP